MRWQWHQPDHMQIIYTLIQTDNHASASTLNFLPAECLSLCPTNKCQITEGSFVVLCVVNQCLVVVLQTRFAMTFTDHNPEMFSPPTKYHLLCLQADAYFYCSQYKQAEVESVVHWLAITAQHQPPPHTHRVKIQETQRVYSLWDVHLFLCQSFSVA